MKNVITVSFAYIAAVIGAGFASGAEIVSFFLVYGKKSITGIILSGVLFFAFAYMILSDCRKYKISGFDEYLSFLMPPFWKKVTGVVVVVFMAISLAAMSAAAGEIIFNTFGIPKIIGVIVFSSVLIFTLAMSLTKITRLNGILGGIMTVGIIISCLYIINFRFLEVFKIKNSMMSSAVSYTAYNGISAAVILCSMSKFLKDKKETLLTSVYIGAGLFAIMTLLWCVIGIYYGKVDVGQIPMLFIARRQGIVFYSAYSIILFIAVFTTAVSNGFGIMEYLNRWQGERISLLIVFIFSVFLSGIGFYKIVDVAYRLCGYAALILPVFILKNRVKRRKREKKRDIIE